MGSEWQNFSEGFGRILKVSFIVLLLLTPLVFLAYSASRWNFLDNETPPSGSPQKKIIKPETFEERLTAPGASLLPTKTNTARAAVPPSESSRIISRGGQFLQRWENYLPPLLSGKKSNYSKALRPFVYSSGAAAIFSRDDVSTIRGLCPESKCFLGSELVGKPKLKIIDFSGREAYLTGSGLIRAISEDASQVQFYEQEYALLMLRGSSDWFVLRVVAKTS